MKKIEKDYKDAISNMDKAKSRFHSSAKNSEVAKLDSELAKLSNITPQEKEKFHVKSNTTLKEAKDLEKQYINSLNSANNIRIIYIESSKSILGSYQVLEEELIVYSKELIRNYFIYTNVSVKNVLFDIEKCYQQADKVNMYEDLQQFIVANQTKLYPPDQIEYSPYSIILRSKPIEEINYPPEVVYNVIVTIQSAFDKTSDYVCIK
jgi:hypothetical protein